MVARPAGNTRGRTSPYKLDPIERKRTSMGGNGLFIDLRGPNARKQPLLWRKLGDAEVVSAGCHAHVEPESLITVHKPHDPVDGGVFCNHFGPRELRHESETRVRLKVTFCDLLSVKGALRLMSAP